MTHLLQLTGVVTKGSGKILAGSLRVSSVAPQWSCCHFLCYASAFLEKVLHCPHASDRSVHSFSSTEQRFQCFPCIRKNYFKHKGKISGKSGLAGSITVLSVELLLTSVLGKFSEVDFINKPSDLVWYGKLNELNLPTIICDATAIIQLFYSNCQYHWWYCRKLMAE